jgi:threonine dehydratase
MSSTMPAAYAAQLSRDDGMVFVPPFDDYEVLCGQGTIGMEILQDVPDVTDVVVPLGGGGLGAGVALAIKTFRPQVRVIGAIPEGSPAFKDSFAAGYVVPASQVVTSAEGVAVKRPGELTFALLNELMDDLVTVSERDINEMILLMLEKHKLVIEAAGAVSLARARTPQPAFARVRLGAGAACHRADSVGRQHRHRHHGRRYPEGHDRARSHHELRSRAARYPRPAGQGGYRAVRCSRERHRPRP